MTITMAMWKLTQKSVLSSQCVRRATTTKSLSFQMQGYRITIARIHIPSRPVVPNNYNLVQTIKSTSKVAVWMSEVLLNHKIFSKILIWFYTFSLYSYFSST